MDPACGGGRREREGRGVSLEEGKIGKTSRFGIQVRKKEQWMRSDKGRKRCKVAERGIWNGGSLIPVGFVCERDRGAPVSNGYIPRESGT